MYIYSPTWARCYRYSSENISDSWWWNCIKQQKEAGGSIVSHCEECESSFCLDCSTAGDKLVLAHHGSTCAEAKLGDRQDIRQHVNAIDNIMTLRCNKCSAAFYDFSGCCAITCESKCTFCAWCLQICPADSSAHHSHVSKLRLESKAGQSLCFIRRIPGFPYERKKRQVTEYLRHLPDELQRMVKHRASAQLRDIGL